MLVRKVCSCVIPSCWLRGSTNNIRGKDKVMRRHCYDRYCRVVLEFLAASLLSRVPM